MSHYHMGAGWTLGRMLFTGLMLLAFAVVTFRALRSSIRAERAASVPAGNLIIPKPSAPQSRVSV
jgi:hypothetical protein